MDANITTRQAIAADADLAAAFYVAGGVKPVNPHEEGTDAHAVWEAAFARYVQAHGAPDCEASA